MGRGTWWHGAGEDGKFVWLQGMGINSGVEGQGKVASMGVEVIRMTADSPTKVKEKGMECLIDEGWQLKNKKINFCI